MTTKAQPSIAKKSLPDGLATVAFLKARFDEGVDHIEIFMPLIIDTVGKLPNPDFVGLDVQKLLQERHGLFIPQQTLEVLLKRAVDRLLIGRDYSRYQRIPSTPPSSGLQSKKEEIRSEQDKLAESFKKFAAYNERKLASKEEGLNLIFDFLKDNEIAILFDRPQTAFKEQRLSSIDSRLVAKFIQEIVKTNNELSVVVNNIVEGLVVYSTAFLSDITAPSRLLSGLKVYLDTRFLFQVLGYYGQTAEILTRETLDLLRNSDVPCFCFDKTIKEMKGILTGIARDLGTAKGIVSSTPDPLTKYLMENSYAPSDVIQAGSMLEADIEALGITCEQSPIRQRKFTLDEKKLSKMLANPKTNDIHEPRVVHDVDCVAAILTIRKGKRAKDLSQAKAVFASPSRYTIRTVGQWFAREGEPGIAPMIHIRALTNLAWLRKPALSMNLKLQELLVLCQAALQPSRETWERFLKHLNRLEKDGELTTEEAVAIVVSEMTDRYYDDFGDDDTDATTIEEIVQRVRLKHECDARNMIAESELKSSEVIAAAKRGEHIAVEDSRRMRIRLEGKSNKYASRVSNGVVLVVRLIAGLGAIAIIIGHPFNRWIDFLVGGVILVFIVVEYLGILSHTKELRISFENWLLIRARQHYGLEANHEWNAASLLGLNNAQDEE